MTDSHQFLQQQTYDKPSTVAAKTLNNGGVDSTKNTENTFKPLLVICPYIADTLYGNIFKYHFMLFWNNTNK